MWDLLDSGKISILQASYYGTKVYHLTLKLEDCIENGSVESKNGKIISGLDYHDKFFKSEEDGGNPIRVVLESKDGEEKKEPENLFIPSRFYWCIQSIWDSRFITDRELKEHLKTMDEKESIEFLTDTINKAI